MAWIEERRNKDGKITSYRIIVSGGMDSEGKQIRKKMTWRPPKENMSEKQVEKALNRAVADFEREIEQGYSINRTQTFTEYAEYVIELKERTGVRPRTIDRYKDLMVRIDNAIGSMKLSDIRPQHLNDFYKELGKDGVRKSGDKALIEIDLAKWLKENGYSQAKLSREAEIAPSTVRMILGKRGVSRETANKVSAVIGESTDKLFSFNPNTKPLSKKTILEYHRFISTVMAQAEKEMVIPYNPAAKATPPKPERKEPDYYQPEVVDAILDALEKVPLKWKTITYLLIDTGCRRGEIMGLKWKNIDMDNGILTIDHALLYSAKRGIYEGPPKNGHTRIVRIAPESKELLIQHKREQEYLCKVNGDRWIQTEYVFTQDNGAAMNPDSATDWLDKFSEKYGLPHVHPHAFRHTAASTMIANGADLVTTANELGHSNATTTATIYAHQIAEAKAKAESARFGVFSHRRNKSDDDTEDENSSKQENKDS